MSLFLQRKTKGHLVLEREMLDQLIKRLLKKGAIELTDWNGAVAYYGDPSLQPLRVKVNDPSVVREMIRNASIALGEAYTDGRVEIDERDLLELFKLVFSNRRGVRRQPALRLPNITSLQQRHIQHHYDLGNEYYSLWLDPYRQYSCAYWAKGVTTLEEAQERKLDLIFKKLQLQKGQRVLDIGCGWGHLAIEAARRHKVKVLGVTLSKEQYDYACSLIAPGGAAEDVAHLVTFELKNYQHVTGRFDRIVSVGMFEHVGRHNQPAFFKAVRRLLKPGGVMMLHTITQRVDRPVDAWVAKHVFPGGYLPTVDGVIKQATRHGLWHHGTEDMHLSYAKTLAEWAKRHRDQRDQMVDTLSRLLPASAQITSEQMYRLRLYWLAASEAAFRWGDVGVTQFMLRAGKSGEQPMLDDVYV